MFASANEAVKVVKIVREGGCAAACTPIKAGADNIIVDGRTELLNEIK
ncbi:MAG: hypothetical protein IJE62_04060 [Clostridia bacterium]|nr:hypothetical protein [Clostridia bacterium]